MSTETAPPPRPPSVDALARSLAGTGLPHLLLVELARRTIADGTWPGAAAQADELRRTLLQPVVNATGVLLHTNLGRAPIARTPAGDDDAVRASNLELDLSTGARGSRQSHVGRLAALACGAEAAMIVNNNAAAVLLVTAALAGGGREVLVARGESVEIGGAFRVPEVVAQSGAVLRDVGTTNRTRHSDFAAAVSDRTAFVLKVHPSNYRVEGFVESVAVGELADLPVPVVADIGSGLLDAACPWLTGGPPAWLHDEPAARQTLDAGAALVTFSGDKLLGGPQAGIVAGRADLVALCARHPLARALRPGGLVLAALQDVLLAHLRRDVVGVVPFWTYVATPVETLAARATEITRRAGRGEVTHMDALPGAGSLPGVTMPSAGVSIDGDHTAPLRRRSLPILARVRDGRTHLDLRAVDPRDDALLAVAIAELP